MKYFVKVSITLSFLILIILGCEKIPDGIINPEVNSFQVTSVTAPDTFNFNNLDSTLNVSLRLQGSIIPIKEPLGFLQNSKTRETLIAINLSKLQKTDSSGIIIAVANGYVEMQQKFPSGNYDLVFQTINEESQIAATIAVHKFFYNNGKENFLPEISNLKIYYTTEQPTLRDTVEINKDFIVSIRTIDADGLDDISKVSFDLFHPDFPNPSQFLMYDDGDVLHGDAIAGDGIFSRKLSFNQTASNLNWKFNFSAIDKNDSTSNVITHNLYVK